MAGLTDAARDEALDAIGALATRFSLHSADPGSAGANELTGGSPAYARQAGTWAAASGGEMLQGGDETFDIPAGSDVAYWGSWSSDGTVFYGSGALDAVESYAGQGQYKLTGAKMTLT